MVLGASEWIGPLKSMLQNPHFSFKEWKEENIEGLVEQVSGFKTILIALPEGEDDAASLLKARIDRSNPEVVFLRLLRDVFIKVSMTLGGRLHPQEDWNKCSPDSPSFFIFAIPRTGSTFFCDILGKTMLLGHPKEHLLADLLPVFFNTDLTFNEWLRAFVKFSFTPNGYSGTKLISHHFLNILESYNDRPELVEDLMNFFKPHPVIYLVRRNKVRQAVSLILAENSKVWHLRKDKTKVGSGKDQHIDVDPGKIENSMKWFYEQEKKMEDFFRKAGIIPSTYFYEDFSDNRKSPGIFKEIGQILQVSMPDSIPEPNYEVMSDEQNEILVRQYYEYLDRKMRGSEFPQEPISSFIMSSMMVEIENLSRPDKKEIISAQPAKKKRWKWF